MYQDLSREGDAFDAATRLLVQKLRFAAQSLSVPRHLSIDVNLDKNPTNGQGIELASASRRGEPGVVSRRLHVVRCSYV